MKLLILTQKVDKHDDHFTFFLDWIREFAKQYDQVTVIALWVGPYELPSNVKVLSLGKEDGVSRIKYLRRLYWYIWQERNNYDQVFVHMNPEYVVLAGWVWRLWGKTVSLWYTHRQVSVSLRIAHIFVHHIFSASDKSFRIKSKKLHAVGHGVNTAVYQCDVHTLSPDTIKILTISRIAPIKNLDTFIRAIHLLRSRFDTKVEGLIVSKLPKEGDEHYGYYKSLIALSKELEVQDNVKFLGHMPGHDVATLLCRVNVCVNACPTGGHDKAVLESMSAGVPCLASNVAYVPDFGKYSDVLMFELHNDEDLANKLDSLIKHTPSDMPAYLRSQIVTRHSHDRLIQNMSNIMKAAQ